MPLSSKSISHIILTSIMYMHGSHMFHIRRSQINTIMLIYYICRTWYSITNEAHYKVSHWLNFMKSSIQSLPSHGGMVSGWMQREQKEIHRPCSTHLSPQLLLFVSVKSLNIPFVHKIIKRKWGRNAWRNAW